MARLGPHPCGARRGDADVQKDGVEDLLQVLDGHGISLSRSFNAV